jgi:hypothetical protein
MQGTANYLAEIEADIASLQQSIEWMLERPWRGACGDMDGAQDALDSLKRERKKILAQNESNADRNAALNGGMI